MRGRISDFVGYYFNYRDNTERGSNIDREKFFASETGVIISKGGTDSFEYSETRGGFTFEWKWGTLQLQKIL